MKKLELKQMENLEGGSESESMFRGFGMVLCAAGGLIEPLIAIASGTGNCW